MFGPSGNVFDVNDVKGCCCFGSSAVRTTSFEEDLVVKIGRLQRPGQLSTVESSVRISVVHMAVDG